MVPTPTDDTNPINQDDKNVPNDDVIIPLPGKANYQNAEVIDDDGSQDVGGDEQGLETDDNVLDAAKSAGLYQNSADDAQQEVDIAGEVDKAEKHRQHNDD